MARRRERPLGQVRYKQTCLHRNGTRSGPFALGAFPDLRSVNAENATHQLSHLYRAGGPVRLNPARCGPDSSRIIPRMSQSRAVAPRWNCRRNIWVRQKAWTQMGSTFAQRLSILYLRSLGMPGQTPATNSMLRWDRALPSFLSVNLKTSSIRDRDLAGPRDAWIGRLLYRFPWVTACPTRILNSGL